MSHVREPHSATRGRLAVLLLVAVVAGGTACQQQAVPTPTSPPATGDLRPPVVPLIVSPPRIATNGPTEAVVGLPVMVSSHALGETAISVLELWDGAELAASEQSDPRSTSPAFYARWIWTPLTAGEHVLYVRVVDGNGRGVQSAAVRVAVREPLVSVGPPAQATQAVARVGAGGWLDGGPAQAAYGIAAPAVQATQAGCQLTLAISGAPVEATGIAVYGLAPSTGMFSPLISGLVAQTGSVEIKLDGGGGYLFTATAFNDQVEAYSQPVALTAPPECAPATGGWTGEISLVDGRLSTSTSVDRAYLYLSEGDGAAVRVPPSMGQFVDADADRNLDFGSLLPPIGSSPLEIEGWGWSGETLVSLGSGRFVPPPAPSGTGGLTFGGDYSVGGSPILPGAGVFTKLWVIEKVLTTASASPGQCAGEFCYIDQQSLTATIERPKPTDSKDITRRFQWSTVAPNVSEIVWQVFPYPPPASADLNPPFIVDQGVVSVIPGQSEGEFPIDFAKYLKPGVPSVTLGTPGLQQQPVSPVFVWPGASPAPSPTPVPSGSGGDNVVPANLPNPVAFSDRFYVRIIPLQFNAASLPSNAVTLDVVEAGGGIAISLPAGGTGSNENAYTINWTYSPPVAANPKYARCATVTGFTSDYVALTNPFHAQLKASLDNQTPICYEPPDDDGWGPWDAFDAFVEYVADVWDYVSDGIKWIKKQIVSFALTAIPCQEIASAATCEAIASTAVDLAIASLTGMPPSLPNFDAVLAGMKGDLATLIVESAGSIPGVATACGIADATQTVTSKLKSCEDLAGIAVDAAIDEMLAASSEAAGNSTGYAWPGVQWKADPRGLYHPPSFAMTITRTADPVLPTTCTATASMQSLVKGWPYPELQQGVVKHVTGDVKGEPLLASSFVIPPLETGESLTRTLWLVHPRIGWFESSHAQLYWNYHESMLNVPNYTRAWVLLTQGAELMFHVTSNCAKASQKGPHILSGNAWGETP